MKIVTWNINGVRARIGNLTHWLTESAPDIVCLQEIKTVDEQFPRAEIEALGYNVETHGQKGFNGVAILSKLRFDEVIAACRATMPTSRRASSKACSRPTRAPCASSRSICRTAIRSMTRRSSPTSCPGWRGWSAGPQERLRLEEALVLAGDYNVIPEPIDARFPENWLGDALFQPQTRQAFRRLLNLGFTEAVRAVTDAPDTYTFWDYQAGAWQKNNGIRIDHLLLSPEAANRFSSASIEKHVRAWEKPSDHVPVAIDLALQPA